jgi:hypothetical protein
MRQTQMCFGRYQLGEDPNRASLFVRVKCWEIIADNLSAAGWSWGCVRRNRNRSFSLTESEHCLATRRKTIT